MAETEKIKRIIIEAGGKEYELTGGGSGGGDITPGVAIPENTVDSAAIQDGSVDMDDLNEEVKKKMSTEYDSGDEKLYIFGVKPSAQPAADYDEAGDDGSDDI